MDRYPIIEDVLNPPGFTRMDGDEIRTNPHRRRRAQHVQASFSYLLIKDGSNGPFGNSRNILDKRREWQFPR